MSVTARVIPGSTKLFGPVMSIAGNQPSRTEKMNTSTTPSQNAGVAWARATYTSTARSNGPFGPAGSRCPQRQGEQCRRGHRHTRQRQRVGKGGDHRLAHRLGAVERGAEVTVEEVAQVVAVLGEQRSVGAEPLAGSG